MYQPANSMPSNVICTFNATVTNLHCLGNKLSHWNMINLLLHFIITLASASPKEKCRGLTSSLMPTWKQLRLAQLHVQAPALNSLALTIYKWINSSQSPFHARCSSNLHNPLTPSLGDTPHNSTMGLATMTLTCNPLSLLSGAWQWGKQSGRGVVPGLWDKHRTALQSAHVAVGMVCCTTTTWLVLNAGVVLFMGEAAVDRTSTGNSGDPSSPTSFHGINKDKRGVKVRGF